jgi:hypothetical protein
MQADIATSWDTMKRSYASVDDMVPPLYTLLYLL